MLKMRAGQDQGIYILNTQYSEASSRVVAANEMEYVVMRAKEMSGSHAIWRYLGCPFFPFAYFPLFVSAFCLFRP